MFGLVKNRRQQKVFCVGCNKTGTTSLRSAMEELGYRFGDQHAAERLAEKTWGQRDFTRLISYCRSADAFQDAPFSFPFTFQAMDIAFPGSRFILTVRSSSDDWYRSLTRFHGKLFADGRIPPERKDLEEADYIYRGRPWVMNRLLFDSPVDDPYCRETLIGYYENHVYSVRQYFRHRPDDLLVIDVSQRDAYRRLCEFLGKPVVSEEFPHLNRTDAS